MNGVGEKNEHEDVASSRYCLQGLSAMDMARAALLDSSALFGRGEECLWVL